MELQPFVCSCGRAFTVNFALSNHQNNCKQSKKRIAGALDSAQAAWRARKKRKTNGDSSTEIYSFAGLSVSVPDPTFMQEQSDDIPVNEPDDSHLSMMERRKLLPKRTRQPTFKLRDQLPQPPAPLTLTMSPRLSVQTDLSDNDPTVLGSSSSPSSVTDTSTTNPDALDTQTNIFGVFRRYSTKLAKDTYDSDESLSLQDLSDIPVPETNPTDSGFYPFPNRSSFRLADWHWNGGVQKSLGGFHKLVALITHPDFSTDDIKSTKWSLIHSELGTEDDEADWLDEDAGWTHTSVTISVPYQSRRGVPSLAGAGPRSYTIDGFYHRKLVSVMREKILGLGRNHQFRFFPYEMHWKCSEHEKSIRIQGELFSSPEFNEADRDIQDMPGEPGCSLPRVLMALMFWSDATQLTSFGSSKIWPLYMYFGNDSKYLRCKPSSHLCEHIAYFQTLPSSFQDFASAQTAGGASPSKPFVTHCLREFFHEQWKVLLDDEFVEAWIHGLVLRCPDGIERRFYPRIFTYSADYPEKILIASIRNLGKCPCPRCCIPLKQVHQMGMPRDSNQRLTLARVDGIRRQGAVTAARRIIYDMHYPVNSAAVEALLKDESLTPNINAFSLRLGPIGFDIFKVLLPDEMHEIALGVWRDIFKHLLRILESEDELLILKLNKRYRALPSFGRDKIRRFVDNCSEMKQMAAHNFEDLLQCAIVVFDGLLPEPHNTSICELLFIMSHWHGLAKLRMHNDLTLDVMDEVTILLGASLRHFKDVTASAFETRELGREYNARLRRKARGKAVNATSGAAPPAPVEATTAVGTSTPTVSTSEANRPTVLDADAASIPTAKAARKRVTFNMNTYKAHSFPDYVRTIRRFGTTDSYSTEPGELEHRNPKSRYTRTSRKHFLKQMTQIERRQARLRRIRAKNGMDVSPVVEILTTTGEAHHNIGISQNLPESISHFLQKNSTDPTIKDFIPKLKSHLLSRIEPHSDIVSSAEQDQLFFQGDRIYRHNIGKFNYTTYDVQRSQDVINPRTDHCDIMLLSQSCDSLVAFPDSNDLLEHPFTYARVLGIYHANVVRKSTAIGPQTYNPERMEFLFVRWFKYLRPLSVRWADLKLDSLGFLPVHSEMAFGFVDPADVLRGSHILPWFRGGKVHVDQQGISRIASDKHDWCQYRVNRFADRDILMRYHWGLAVGHIYTRGRPKPHNKSRSTEPSDERSDIAEIGGEPESDLAPVQTKGAMDDSDGSEDEDAEFSLESRDKGDSPHSSDSEKENEPDSEDDERILAMEEMYS